MHGRAAGLGRGVALATALACALPVAAPASVDVDVTARVGEEVVLRLGTDGSVRDASTVVAPVTRERRGDVYVVTLH